MSTPVSILREFFDQLLAEFGPQDWWPGETQAEIVIGAILTQNTSWTNVERAIANLKAADALDFKSLRDIDPSVLGELIRPAGYYNVKSKRLKNFVEWLWTAYGGDVRRLTAMPLETAREQLLAVNGIGPETADSILLYALGRPTFVVDAYTTRVLRRHGLVDLNAGYGDVQSAFENELARDAQVYNEYHALLVRLGKVFCRPAAKCDGCPLKWHEHDVTVR